MSIFGKKHTVNKYSEVLTYVTHTGPEIDSQDREVIGFDSAAKLLQYWKEK